MVVAGASTGWTLRDFAETDGYEHDKIRSNAWRYRDWIVNALNSDMRLRSIHHFATCR